MTHFLNTPVDKSLSTSDSWLDIDLSSDIPAQATGAIFQIINTDAGGDYTFGLRKNGSSDDRYKTIDPDAQLFMIVGVDGNQICEGRQSSNYVDFHLVGYTESDATLFTNAYDKSQTTLGAWTDLDLSSELPAGSVAAIFEVVNASMSPKSWGLRKKGGTDNRYDDLGGLIHVYFIVGVDTNRKSQFKIESADIVFFLLGYLKSGIAETNGVDRSLGSTGSYIDITESNAPAGSTGAFVEFDTSTPSSAFAARKNGISWDKYSLPPAAKSTVLVGLDESKKWEGKIATTNHDFYTLGYFSSDYEEMGGKLEVHQGNPRYFRDASGEIIYLTGAHTWGTVQNIGNTHYPPEFDYVNYLNFLKAHNHNFLRLWVWEGHVGFGIAGYESQYVDPPIYSRPGPGTALDGRPKYDLNQFNQDYFDRLLDRVTNARNQGIYVSVMFFQGWSVASGPDPGGRWEGHPCNPANNINGVDGGGSQIHTMTSPVMEYQKTYIRKVINTLQNSDNVIWEIGNELLPSSKDFQYHMIDYIRSQDTMSRKVGMTGYYGSKVSDLFNSSAEWISPGDEAGYEYETNPPAADGSKVILLDTDHVFGIGGDVTWVWKVFTRGHNILFMDCKEPLPEWEPSRDAMGDTLTYANKMVLVNMSPRGDLTSTGYGLANPGEVYLVFQPGSGSFNVTLASGTYNVEWFNPRDRTYHDGGTADGGGSKSFRTSVRGQCCIISC